MLEQLTMFSDAPRQAAPSLPDAPSIRHSATSRQAAADIRDALPELEARVLAWLRKRGEAGGCDFEGIAALSLDPSTYRPRRRNLELMGLVVDSGETRVTGSGRRATVWRAV